MTTNLREDDRDSLTIFDARNGITRPGSYAGAIVTRLKDFYDSIIISDNVAITGDILHVDKGLLVGFEKTEAFSRPVTIETSIGNGGPGTVDYVFRVGDEIIEQFDQGSFSNAFPYTLSFLHSAGILKIDEAHAVNHLDFVRGEILARPVARYLQNAQITFADRLVVDQRGDPVFYNCFHIRRGDACVSAEYEPIATVDEQALRYLLIIGSETLKR